LTNGGLSPLVLASIAITGTNSGDFAETNSCGASVAVGASCAIYLTFTPRAIGLRSASVIITDGSGNQQTISMSGTGVSFFLSTTVLVFLDQTVGTTSPVQTVTLTNNSMSTLGLGNITIMGANNGEFAQTNTCGTSLAVGASCTIRLTFTPGVLGLRNASIIITDAGGNQQAISVSGTGVSFLLSNNDLFLGNQNVGTTSPPQVVTLTNGGPSTLGIGSIAVTGVNSGDFAQTNTCGSSVAVGASCTIRVTFSPSALDFRYASVIIVDGSGNNQTIFVFGTGIKTRQGQLTSGQ
jgi:hypothetical protein